MISLTQIRATPNRRDGLLFLLRRHLADIVTAHNRRARFDRQIDEAARDCGLPPECLMGEPAHDPALPFFMQAGFGRD